MKLNKIQHACLLASVVMASSVSAVDLQITGSVLEPACTVLPTPGATDIQVQMNGVDKADFDSIGKAVGKKAVKLDLTCTANSNVTIRIDGSFDPNNRNLLMLNDYGTGAAEGVAVGFYDASNTLVPLNTDFPAVALAGTAGGFPGRFDFSVAYIATLPFANVMAGSANASAQISVVTP